MSNYNNDDYKEEKNKIAEDELSRANRRNQKKKNVIFKYPFLSTLLIAIIIIPLACLITYAYVHENADNKNEVVKDTSSDSSVVIEKNTSAASKETITAAQKEKQAAKEQAAKEQESKKAEEEKAAKEAQAAKESSSRAAEQSRNEASSREAEANQTSTSETSTSSESSDIEEKKPASSYTVQAGDTLYHIALISYGSGSAENQALIRNANGISGNTVSVGATLTIPAN